MKKLIVALLLACMVFTVLVAAENEIDGLYSRFDFGTKSKAVDQKKTSDEDLRAKLEDDGAYSYTNFEYISVESTADTWIVTALVDTADQMTLGDYLKAYNKGEIKDEQGNVTGYEWDVTAEAFTDVMVYKANRVWAMGLNFCDLDFSDEFEDELILGWGTYSGWPLSTNGANYGKDSAWAGHSQYVKLRVRNNSNAKRFGFAFQNSTGYATTMRTAFAISNNDGENWKTYIVDGVLYSDVFSGKTSHCSANSGGGNNWTWHQSQAVDRMCFWVFGPWCAYDAKLATSTALYNWIKYGEIASTEFNEAEFGAPNTALRVEKLSAWYCGGCLKAVDETGAYNVPTLTAVTKDAEGNQIGYAKMTSQLNKWTAGLDAAAAGKAGDKIEIDYIIFANSYEAASCYTSYLDDATETTGWLVWNAEIDEWLKANAVPLED